YRLSWAEVIAAGNPINPDDPNLRIHRTGQALDEILAVLRDYKARGVIYRGSVDVHPTVVEFNGDKAKVRDCVFDHTEALVEKTSEGAKPAASHPVFATTTLERQNGVWKVVTFAPESQGCNP